MNQADETRLLTDALLFEHGHPRRTQHILKVYALTRVIGTAQRLSEREQRIVQAAAILHDIAIGPCKEKYGEATQEQQQKEAPAIVERLLARAEYDPADWPRILYLVRMHHRYDCVDGMDYQTLIEADLIVNAYESQDPKEKAHAVRPIFRTATGRALLDQI